MNELKEINEIEQVNKSSVKFSQIRVKAELIVTWYDRKSDLAQHNSELVLFGLDASNNWTIKEFITKYANEIIETMKSFDIMENSNFNIEEKDLVVLGADMKLSSSLLLREGDKLVITFTPAQFK